MLKTMPILGLCIAVLFLSSAAKADVPCGSTTCPSNYLCLDRGGGEACWQICSQYVNTCTYCCVSLGLGKNVCGTEAECKGQTDLCKGQCTSLQYCITVSSSRSECMDICTNSKDCDSECCALTTNGAHVCLPEDIECPQEQTDGDSESGDSEKKDDNDNSDMPQVTCGSQMTSVDMGVVLSLLGSFYFIAKRHYRRKRQGIKD